MHLIAALLLAVSMAVAPAPAAEPDPRWRFFTSDKTFYHSPWYRHAHRIMIPFGCTRAPYYSPDPRCVDNRGFHHGIDIAMPCGTRLRSDRWGWVVSNDALGPAYGVNPIRLRNKKHGFDIVIGHTRRVFVKPGDRIRPGTLLGRASDSAAPDGCHLHFEKRALAGGLASATHPRKMLQLRPRA
jgi:murein DD-endopeptidase MepM/ murein hydrolase activator NlpD